MTGNNYFLLVKKNKMSRIVTARLTPTSLTNPSFLRILLQFLSLMIGTVTNSFMLEESFLDYLRRYFGGIACFSSRSQ